MRNDRAMLRLDGCSDRSSRKGGRNLAESSSLVNAHPKHPVGRRPVDNGCRSDMVSLVALTATAAVPSPRRAGVVQW